MIRFLEKRSKSQRVVFTLLFLFFFVYALSLLYPFLWAFFSGLKTNSEFVMGMFDLPKDWLFSNFVHAFTAMKVGGSNMFAMLFNSVWLSVGGTCILIFSSLCLAYVVCKYEFFGRKALFAVNIVIMVFPVVGAGPSAYRIYTMLGFTNSPLFLITYIGGWGFNFIVLHGFFQNLSWSYAEAAFIDGAGDFVTFIRVMLPQAMPAVSTLVILSFIGAWNDYSTPMLYLPAYPTIMTGIYSFEVSMQYASNYPVLFAGILISIIPVLVLFVIFSDRMMTNISVGGLKG